ncbi:hypothetical protein FHX74_002529 [Friedmanniella endophytica]|uniref:Uncharacterized protein n=1 Tax=Microlunatus kandeliicorticis TaxID=1759536 RepID=A0A7W3ITE7_9ACTN|nr:hypothetical protein [Microlunatus kandeliicorticis]
MRTAPTWEMTWLSPDHQVVRRYVDFGRTKSMMCPLSRSYR